jgi:hypothetical protein
MPKAEVTADSIRKGLEQAVGAAFSVAGTASVKVIQDSCNSEDLGRLHDSISYAHKTGGNASARPGSRAEAGDGVPTPDKPFLMYIGTAVPYAVYVEFGSGKHMTGDDSAGFIERITAWGLRHGFTEKEIPNLIRSIRRKGTEKHPFFYANELSVNDIVKSSINTQVSAFFTKMGGAFSDKIDINLTKGR